MRTHCLAGLCTAAAAALALSGCPEPISCGAFLVEIDGECRCPEGTVFVAAEPACRAVDGGSRADAAVPDAALVEADGAACVPDGLEVCDGVDNDCDGAIDGAAASAACEMPVRTSSVGCSAGMCVVLGCSGGYGNCDGELANGCEAALSSDPDHCGDCGVDCGWTCRDSLCDDAVEIAAGPTHSCVLHASGRVACWGQNSSGQLGTGTTEVSVPDPVFVRDLDDAIAITAGHSYTCAIRGTGLVVCWGSNLDGQLGDGTTIGRLVPHATSVTDALEIDAGESTTCARRSSGQVLCWGRNQFGQVGDGTTVDTSTPRAVVGLSDATDLAVGDRHGCARRASGPPACWGSNFYGQLGDGSATDRSAPVSVMSTVTFSEIAAGARHTCARDTGGRLRCWGQNSSGQLGDGTTTGARVPVAVLGVTDGARLALGAAHSCVRRAGGELRCWGSNRYGQLGDGTTTGPATSAIDVTLIGAASEISASDDYTCARTGTDILCWGVGHGMTSATVVAPPG